MSTRSRVGLISPNGSITSIYTHWDGYPSHHVPILRDHYRDTRAVAGLLSLGDLSSLGTSPGEKHDFDEASPEFWCTAYGRDRGEEDCQQCKSADIEEFQRLCDGYGAEYAYLFDGYVWWMAGAGYTNNPYQWELATEGVTS